MVGRVKLMDTYKSTNGLLIDAKEDIRLLWETTRSASVRRRQRRLRGGSGGGAARRGSSRRGGDGGRCRAGARAGGRRGHSSRGGGADQGPEAPVLQQLNPAGGLACVWVQLLFSDGSKTNGVVAWAPLAGCEAGRAMLRAYMYVLTKRGQKVAKYVAF